jgi:hypothetical protein
VSREAGSPEESTLRLGVIDALPGVQLREQAAEKADGDRTVAGRAIFLHANHYSAAS